MKNMGALDRTLRLLIAIAIAAAYLLHWISGLWAAILGVVFLIFLATSLIGVCPAYLPFRFSTIQKSRR